ncbi:hypothetical protein [Trichormus azollae]|uniref:hypothetical protein n=1 Tax=Trichormus azollae TaxID=1164 RepID=UPI00325CB64C
MSWRTALAYNNATRALIVALETDPSRPGVHNFYHLNFLPQVLLGKFAFYHQAIAIPQSNL